ncbi:MAG: metallophosphoesterase [Candidatus Pacebacteria bacterium]|nr:metallophosphoesterase [Candidatus Paceibacterota bacterium]
MIYGLYLYNPAVGNRQILIFEDGNNRGAVGSGWSLNTDYSIAIVLKTTGAKYYIKGGKYGTDNSWSLLYDSSYSSESNLKVGFAFGTPCSENVMAMDDVSVVDSGLPFVTDNSNIMIAKPTLNSVTILRKTSFSSDVTIDYGLTDSYGNTTSSTNKTIHELLISGLSPSTTYHYRITTSENGNPEDTTSTSDLTFKTQLEPGNDFSFVIIGDIQGGDPSGTVNQIQALNPDLILTVGDNIQGEGVSSVTDFETRWQIDVFDYIQDLTSHIPLFTTLGNHDAAISNFNNGITAYQQQVAMPTSDSGGEKYYSFDYGDAHFVVLNGTYNGSNAGTIDSTQLSWLENDLQSTDKTWKFVFCHYLIYGADNAGGMLTTWRLSNYTDVATIMKNNGVTAWFNGHRHVYNRYVKDGVFYIGNPCAGSGWGCPLDDAYGGEGDNYANSGGDTGTLVNTVGDYVGFTKVSVTSLGVSAVIYEEDGTVIDSFDLTSGAVPIYPTIGASTVLSSSAIRWNFTDNSSFETGFRVYTNADAIATSSATANLTYLDETGLSENTQYTRYVKAYNDYGESSSSSATSTYTLADTPTGFNFMRHPLSLDIYVDRFTNDTLGSSGYLFWRTDNSAYNSGWIQTNQWQDLNMVEGQTYTYAVKYRNANGIETATTTLGGVSFIREVGGGGTPNVVDIGYQPQITASSTQATTTQNNASTSSAQVPNLAGLTGQARQVAIQQIRDMITQIQNQLVILIGQLIQALQAELANMLGR